MSLWAGALSAKPSWGFSLHRSTEQTALMRTQIPSFCIDLQNRCIGEGKSMTAERPPSTRWPAGDLNKKSWRASACRPSSEGKGLITILYAVPLITSVFSSHLTQSFSREGHTPVSPRQTALIISYLLSASMAEQFIRLSGFYMSTVHNLVNTGTMKLYVCIFKMLVCYCLSNTSCRAGRYDLKATLGNFLP